MNNFFKLFLFKLSILSLLVKGSSLQWDISVPLETLFSGWEFRLISSNLEQIQLLQKDYYSILGHFSFSISLPINNISSRYTIIRIFVRRNTTTGISINWDEIFCRCLSRDKTEANEFVQFICPKRSNNLFGQMIEKYWKVYILQLQHGYMISFL